MTLDQVLNKTTKPRSNQTPNGGKPMKQPTDPFNGISLGDRVRDTLTGFEGIANGRVEYLTGCAQVLVTPDRLRDDGTRIDGWYIDADRLAVVTKGAYKTPTRTRAGSDIAAPTKH